MSTLLLESPNVLAREDLCVERDEIVFHNLTPERVAIEVTVRNLGGRRSASSEVVLQAAPLGAFVPWQPLATLTVPPLEPGQPFVLRTEARRTNLQPLGKPDRVSPVQVLPTALGLREPQRADQQGLLDRPTGLPQDLFELLGHSNPHWAGNLNVFIGRHVVERHLARALRIYPGRVNLAMFMVGSGPDAYAFHLTGEGAGWDAGVFNITDGRSARSLTVDVDGDSPVAEDQWIELRGPGMMMLAIRPPEHCTQGEVHVHVEQRSSGRTATVEFRLDPNAAGPGCFLVD